MSPAVILADQRPTVGTPVLEHLSRGDADRVVPLGCGLLMGQSETITKAYLHGCRQKIGEVSLRTATAALSLLTDELYDVLSFI